MEAVSARNNMFVPILLRTVNRSITVVLIRPAGISWIYSSSIFGGDTQILTNFLSGRRSAELSADIHHFCSIYLSRKATVGLLAQSNIFTPLDHEAP